MGDFALQFGDTLLIAGIDRQITNVIDVDDFPDMRTLVLLNLDGEEFAILPARPASGLTTIDRRPNGGIGLESAESRYLWLGPKLH